MKTKHRPPIAIVLLTAFLLAFAGTVSAANIVVESVTVTLSSLMPSLQPTDTITVRNGGTLWIDNGDTEVTIAGLQIGDATTIGSVLFSGTRSTLKVTGDVKFGPYNPGGGVLSALDMAFITPTTPHTLRVGGKFLAEGAGKFMAGAGTIEYYATSTQDITASVGGSGFITYKNLILSGSPAEGSASKVFANGVSVQGVLFITGKAVPTGSAVAYGSLSSLIYGVANGQTMRTTGIEWPTTVSIPVIVTNISATGSAALELDADKTINAVASPANSLTLRVGTLLKDAGKVLTVKGTILNNGAITGVGRLELGGTAAQALTGVGTYGNVTLNNAAGASLPGDNDCTILGRLIISNGKLNLLSGDRAYSTALLSLGAADKAAGYYGSTSSGAPPANQSDVYFAGVGKLAVQPKLPAVVSIGKDHQQVVGAFTNVYGETSVTITGLVTTAAEYLPFGNGPKNESVTVTITPASPAAPATATVNLANNGSYNATLTTTTMPVGTWPIKVEYAGGDNVAAASLTTASPAGMIISKKPVKIIASGGTKVYDGLTTGTDFETEPNLAYTTEPASPWVGTDLPTGKLARDRGEAVGKYNITDGTLADNLVDNYQFTWDLAKQFEITKKTIEVTPRAAEKIYNGLSGADPTPFLYDPSQAPFAGDSWTGELGRLPGNTNNTYKFTKNGASGTLDIVPAGNYNVVLLDNVNVFTIKKKAISVSFNNPDPTKMTKIYGENDPALYSDLASKLESGDSVKSGTAPGRASGNDVGTYLINKGSLVIVPDVVTNSYDITWSTTDSLAITRRSISISAVDKSIEYGQTVDQTQFVAYQPKTGTEGLIPGDTFDTPWTIAPKAPTTVLPVTGSPIGTYNFTITDKGADKNYTITVADADGVCTITPASLKVVADNKTKLADNAVFPVADYTVHYETFLTGDTEANSITGTKTYSGSAIAAKDPGVYVITPSGLSSTKYLLKYVNGWLAITDAVRSNYVNGAEAWSGVNTTPVAKSNLVCYINQANGNPGSKPGWTIRVIKNALDLQAATEADPFWIFLVTTGSDDKNSAMAKFDPTRPYSWEVVRAAGGINNIEVADDGTVKDVKLDPSFFVNNRQGGQFKVAKEGNSILVKYSPVGPTGMPDFLTAIPNGYDVNPVLSQVAGPASDLDALYLEIAPPQDLEITPQETITVDLKVANLKQKISGVEAYIAFSSTMFATEGPGAPVVVPGMGDWKTLIFTNWNQGGDLDAVIGVSLGNATGTDQSDTVAKITLTPNRTSTGKSRVTFRRDGANDADYLNDTTGRAVTNSLITASGGIVLPARVMTPEILITVDGNGPAIDPTSTTKAEQVQPHVGVVNVKNGGAAKPVVQTSAGISESTVSGPVIITVPITDAGVGIKGVPTAYVTNAANEGIVLDEGAAGTTPGTFVYQWPIDDKVTSTDWWVCVRAEDTLTTPNITINTNVAKLTVNTTEISGIVEVEQLKGTNRIVTFKSGAGSSATATKTWAYNLSFKSYEFLSAGALQDRAGMANKIVAPPATDPLSTYLRYGSVLDMPALASNLRNQGNGVAAYVHALLYGYVVDLPKLALTLQYTNRAVDVYIRGLLSQATKDALTAYLPPNSAGNSAELTRALLDDFNNIVLGGAIYNEVRFEYVPGATECGTSTSLAPGSDQCVAQNRCHMMAAYPQFVAGELRAQTAQSLAQYPGTGYDATLANYILGDFDTLTKAEDLWPDTWRFACIYDETNFLGVVLSEESQALLTQDPYPVHSELTLLNQYLLQDAFAGQFEKAPLTPETIMLAQYMGGESGSGAFEEALVDDLNALITSGKSIFTAERFAPWLGAIPGNKELSQLLTGNPSGQDLVRMNRMLLELGYGIDPVTKAATYLLSESVLAPYRLVGVPSGTTKVQAKTAWNLAVELPVSGMMTSANFVNNGSPGWTAGADYYLRGGDVVTSDAVTTGDNRVNLLDYNVMRLYFGNTTDANRLRADVDGDNIIGLVDYGLMNKNWAKEGATPLLQ